MTASTRSAIGTGSLSRCRPSWAIRRVASTLTSASVCFPILSFRLILINSPLTEPAEHYFQNTCLGNFSPNVGKLHKRYFKFGKSPVAVELGGTHQQTNANLSEQELKAKHAAARLELEEKKKAAAKEEAKEETKESMKKEDGSDTATDTDMTDSDYESDSKDSVVDIKTEVKEMKPVVKDGDDKSFVNVKTETDAASTATLVSTSVGAQAFLVLTPPATLTATTAEGTTPCPNCTGTREDPIIMNCQYPTMPSQPIHTHHPTPQFPAPVARTNFCRTGDQRPAPHHYHHNENRYQRPSYQSQANRYHSMDTEDKNEGLFVAQPPASWAHGRAAPHGDDYGHRRYY
ncbi:hypothetical protein VTJ49DRAFT_7044 [Mycothermus thermophilus]|uniref:Uncharacterized protein n=1 Tax=Humicola insolens TaxID=85995 RepID=A0ABR3VI14_HUMIN